MCSNFILRSWLSVPILIGLYSWVVYPAQSMTKPWPKVMALPCSACPGCLVHPGNSGTVRQLGHVKSSPPWNDGPWLTAASPGSVKVTTLGMSGFKHSRPFGTRESDNAMGPRCSSLAHMISNINFDGVGRWPVANSCIICMNMYAYRCALYIYTILYICCIMLLFLTKPRT